MALRIRVWPLRAYFRLLIAIFVAGAPSAAIYVHAQTRRDGRRTALADTRFAAETAAGQLGKIRRARASNHRETRGQSADQPDPRRPFRCSLTFAGSRAPTRAISTFSGPTAPSPARPASAWSRERRATRSAVASPRPTAPMSRGPPSRSRDRVAGIDHQCADPRREGSRHRLRRPDRCRRRVWLRSTAAGTRPSSSSRPRRPHGDHAVDRRRSAGSVLARGHFVSRRRRPVERTDLDGKPRLYAESRLPSVGWRLIVGEDKAAAMAAGARLERRQLAIILVGFLGR